MMALQRPTILHNGAEYLINSSFENVFPYHMFSRIFFMKPFWFFTKNFFSKKIRHTVVMDTNLNATLEKYLPKCVRPKLQLPWIIIGMHFFVPGPSSIFYKLNKVLCSKLLDIFSTYTMGQNLFRNRFFLIFILKQEIHHTYSWSHIYNLMMFWKNFYQKWWIDLFLPQSNSTGHFRK